MGKIFLTLDVYLDKNKISRYYVAKKTGIHFDTISKYYKNQVVRYDSYILEKICDVLKCDICDIIAYKREEEL